MALDLAVTLAYLEDIEVTKSGSAAEVVSDLRSNWAPAQFRRNSGDLGSGGECLPILEASQQYSEKNRQTYLPISDTKFIKVSAILITISV